MGCLRLFNYKETDNKLFVSHSKNATKSAFSGELWAKNELFLSVGRYGFNGMERDDEIAGNGNSYTAEFWQYDCRLGRRWNIDPMRAYFPALSPYSVFENSPIVIADNQGSTNTIYIYIQPYFKVDGVIRKLTSTEIKDIQTKIASLMASTRLDEIFDVVYTSEHVTFFDPSDVDLVIAGFDEMQSAYPFYNVMKDNPQHFGRTPARIDGKVPTFVSASHIYSWYNEKTPNNVSLNMTTMIAFTAVHEAIHTLSKKAGSSMMSDYHDPYTTRRGDHSYSGIMGEFEESEINDPVNLSKNNSFLDKDRFEFIESKFNNNTPDLDGYEAHKKKYGENNKTKIERHDKRKNQDLNYSKTDKNGKVNK